MAGFPSIRYDAPEREASSNDWGREWRKRWFRSAGSVHQHWQTRELVAFYSNDRDPSVRLALQSELETRPNGVTEVLAACREVKDSFDREIREANIRYHAAQREA
jgi:hypothetical protein